MGYKIIALIGKAGSGKDTILNKVLDIDPILHKIINSTTREPREGEVEGINYYFLTIDQYTDKLLNNEFVEASYKNWFYGTTYEALRSNCINIGVFNPDSINCMIGRNDIELKIFYINASSKIRLLRYLNREEDPDIDEIIRRYLSDEKDFHSLPFEYESLENNNFDDLNNCVNTIKAAAEELLGKSN